MSTIYSDLQADQAYVSWITTGPHPMEQRKVLVKGTGGEYLIGGRATEVSADDMAALNASPVFQLHLSGGFVRVAEPPAPAVVPAVVVEEGSEQS
jgi:hypothetical protein